MEDSAAAPDLERALAYAHRAIGRREQTVAEISALLERRGVEAPLIDVAIEHLCASGLLDDARFARRFATDKRDLDLWGARRIESELSRRGVGAGEIAAVVDAGDRDEELETALVLLGRRMPGPLEGDRERDRAWRLLVRRGYEPELAYEAVREHDRAGR